MEHELLTFVDLFCGIGGLSLGFRQAGFELLAAVDSDPKRVHWYNACVEPGKAAVADIAKMPLEHFLDALQGRTPDVVIGSPPLNWFAAVGQQMRRGNRSSPEADPHSSLLNGFTRLALRLRPRVILLDLPRSFLRMGAGAKWREELFADLGEYGYSVHLNALNAVDFGVPQKREHVYVIAVRDGFVSWNWPSAMGWHLTLADALSDLLPTLPEAPLPPYLSQGNYPPHGALLVSGQSVDRARPYFVTFDAPSFLLTPSGVRGHRIRDYEGRWRRLTAECCRRLQGFPEGFDQIDVASLASATPPPLAKAIASTVRQMLAGTSGGGIKSLEAFLQSSQVQEERLRIADYFGRDPSARAQQKWHLNRGIDRELRQFLFERFGQKCAYCERAVPLETAAVDRFRPVQEAMDLKGKIHRSHYWWLSFELENLYLACPECSAAKANLFPVLGKRVPLKATGDKLFEEGPALLDPRSDWQEAHWYVESSGRLLPRTRRGDVTIQVLGLNRANLVSERKRVLSELQARWGNLMPLLSSIQGPPEALPLFKESVEFVTRLFAHEPVQSRVPFVSAQRQWLRRFFRENRDLLGRLPDQLQVQIQATSGSRRQSGDLDAHEEADFAISAVIRRIQIRNFMAIDRLELEVPEQKDRYTPWLMLLGENGTGKSSILKAIALTLMGPEQRSRVGIKPESVLRRGSKNGYVRIYLVGETAPLEMRFSLADPEFRGAHQTPPIMLAAYGATRLPPRPGVETEPTSWSQIGARSEAVRCDNLFDPYYPLVDAERWLERLKQSAFDDTAMAIKRLLALDDGKKLTRRERDGKRTVVLDGDRLEQLSDGYRSTIALLADIMSLMQPVFDDSESARGIVLLDELDAHLHPRWMMRIVTGLREVFPRMQFVVTSHDPLCLRGLQRGEVAVVQREDGQAIRAWTKLPSPDGLRVDQLLTSPYFGLHSTIDPEIEAEFQAYYTLLAKPEPDRTEDDQQRIREHQMRLGQFRLMGDTRRDQLMYAAVDEFLAKERHLAAPLEIKQLDPNLLRLLGEIWQSLGVKHDY